jgi:gluconate:H+ symporter, GntP family
MTPHDWILLILTLAAIGLLVLLVTRWKVNAFIALTLAALLVGIGAVTMGLKEVSLVTKDVSVPLWMPGESLTVLRVIEKYSEGLGGTLGKTAAIIALGVMLGKLLAESGGAEVLAKRFAKFFGPERVMLCVMALALVVGLVTWFAVGLLLLLPILLTLTRETKKPFLLLAIPLLSCLSVMHGLMPPHPGPVAAIGNLHANMGKVLVWGFVIGLPTAFVAGPIFARRAVRIVEAQAPEFFEKHAAGRERCVDPGFGLTLFTILLPVALMLVATIAELTLREGAPARAVCSFLGNPTLALTVAALFAMWSLGIKCGFTGGRILKFTDDAVNTVGMTLLVVGGGGGFAKVLDIAGVSRAMGLAADAAHLPPILYGWLVSAFIRVATGSATVAITVASGLLVPVVATHPGSNVELLIMAIGCGSLFLSHLNDGGFWVVRDCLGLSVSQTLRSWTICETIVGIAGLIITLGVNAVWGMVHG